MNHQKSFLYLLTIPFVLFLSAQASAASTISKTEAIEHQFRLLAQTPSQKSYISANVLGAIAVSSAKVGNFDRALEITQSIDVSVGVSILRSIAIELVAVGQLDEALLLSKNQEDVSSQEQILE